MAAWSARLAQAGDRDTEKIRKDGAPSPDGLPARVDGEGFASPCKPTDRVRAGICMVTRYIRQRNTDRRKLGWLSFPLLAGGRRPEASAPARASQRKVRTKDRLRGCICFLAVRLRAWASPS